jgi:ABC-2 type transport system ATP-binding protein
MEDFAVRVDNVTKTFKLPHEKKTSIKSIMINVAKKGAKGYEIQKALDNVSMEVKKGEFFGIVGRNGSGKSTLLKLLAGIYSPSKGEVHIRGSLTPFIELGVGFNPELTGRENVYLNGALLGFSRREMEAMYNEIVDFAEIERFMDQKLKNYSSGMQVRLAFSIATRSKSDILLIDEVLAVGDAAFQSKCFDYFLKLKEQKQTIVFVTHDMSAVKQFCDRAMMLHEGEVVAVGKPEKIAMEYALINAPENIPLEKTSKQAKKDVYINNIVISKDGKKHENKFSYKDTIDFSVEFEVKKPRDLTVTMSLSKTDRKYLAGASTRGDLGKIVGTVGKHKVFCSMPARQFTQGVYHLNVAIVDYKTNTLIDYVDNIVGMKTPLINIEESPPDTGGEFSLDSNWSQTKN